MASCQDGSVIDMILTDVVMPRMSGHEVVKGVLALQPHAKVIYVSGYSNQIIAPWNLPAGRINLLSKPFSVGALATMVREVLDAEKPA
jgi:two-component system cell cycle sensor histidine kinase/response regulator CckA